MGTKAFYHEPPTNNYQPVSTNISRVLKLVKVGIEVYYLRMQEPTLTHEAEIEEGRILNNLHLLEARVLGETSDLTEQQRRELSAAIKLRGGMFQDNGDLLEAITFEYDTTTGDIGLAKKDYAFGERSRINTWILKRKGKEGKEILLYQPGEMPTLTQYNEAMLALSEGRQPQHVSSDRWIMPERVIPEYPELQGPREVWGQSTEPISAKGDIAVLKTIRQFNAKHAPPR